MSENDKLITLILEKRKGVSSAVASRALNKIKRALEEMDQEDKKENKHGEAKV